MSPCVDCGAPNTAPTTTGRCLPCAYRSVEKWRAEKAPGKPKPIKKDRGGA